ncbi:hypothetical protein [Sphaerisporangium dianthi]|uniref:Secreted protein n=1 Tax=Sphaerisporangium dianthi TaxID=1436120 RepID=A0ABV9CCG8_9ACTN
MKFKEIVRRSSLVAVAVPTLMASAMLFTTTPASAAADTLSTTGAWGRYVWQRAGWALVARDPLTDGHCAQWQTRASGGSWQWAGIRVCTATETYAQEQVGVGENTQVRICRTGVGNCSTAVTLN